MAGEDNDKPNYTILPDSTGIAELIGTPGDVDVKTLDKHFPFINKVMAFGNFSNTDILDEKDFLIIKSIITRSKLTRLQKQYYYNRRDVLDARAYLSAQVTLGREGFLVKRITGSYQNVVMQNQEGSRKKGLLGSVLHRNKGGSQDGV